ncbi:hypothetical protein BD560DRAFT_389257 [Blakeslea trispora]|nr:hypothetical protein BD560DRAFT_389257 [Blakeslea trispora]
MKLCGARKEKKRKKGTSSRDLVMFKKESKHSWNEQHKTSQVSQSCLSLQ